MPVEIEHFYTKKNKIFLFVFLQRKSSRTYWLSKRRHRWYSKAQVNSFSILVIYLQRSIAFRWFEGFSWECLKKGTLAAPYVPKVRIDFFSNLFPNVRRRLIMMLTHRISIYFLKMMDPNQKTIWLVGTKNFNKTFFSLSLFLFFSFLFCFYSFHKIILVSLYKK